MRMRLLVVAALWGCGGVENDELDTSSDVVEGQVVAQRVSVVAMTPAELAAQPALDRSTLAEPMANGHAGDFNNDGVMDRLTHTSATVTITLGGGAGAYSYTIPNDTVQRLTSVAPLQLGTEGYTSFMLSLVRLDDGDDFPWHRAEQVFLFNSAGANFQPRVLTTIRIIGRNVKCTRLPTSWNRSACIFASYARDGYAYTTLVDVSETGVVTDLTRLSGLPWNGAGGTTKRGQFTNGKYMMGFAWVDLNADGLPDLVGGGQHSSLMYAFMVRDATKPNGYRFGPATWFGAQDEGLGVSALPNLRYTLPCVYVHVETGSRYHPRGDYVTCFDATSATWVEQPMPTTTVTGLPISSLRAATFLVKWNDGGPGVYLGTRGTVSGVANKVALRLLPMANTPEIVPKLLRSEVFRSSYYLSRNPDVRAAFGNNPARAAEHWLKTGAMAGRQGSAQLWSQLYLARYPDLRAAFGNGYVRAIEHYLSRGIAEGRDGN